MQELCHDVGVTVLTEGINEPDYFTTSLAELKGIDLAHPMILSQLFKLLVLYHFYGDGDARAFLRRFPHWMVSLIYALLEFKLIKLTYESLSAQYGC